jgi:prepilin-type N-terminal cleavage/methylation domain-containing protein
MKQMQGFTLIEMILVIMITGIISSFVGKILVSGFSSYLTAKPIITLAGKANLAVENLMREVKSAESISGITTTSLSFTNEQGQVIIISLTGSNLTRSVSGGSAQLLCDQVSNLIFTGYDNNFANATVAGNVSFVTLSMTVSSGNWAYPLMSGTLIRRLFDA